MAYTAGSLEINLIHKANDVVNVFSALNKELRITKKLIATIMGGTTKTTQKLINRQNKTGGIFGFGNLAKMGATLYTARRIGRVVSEIAQSGADYTETLNLWETSMGKNLGVATEFVNKMNDAYGISEKTLMNAQAIFKNMIGSLGQISDTMAYQLSEGITQMAVDYASLYNQTFEQAFSKFQAVLAGQVRPIRSVAGYDITETTLFQLYQSLGGEKSMRQLTRTEKQLLSILAIFEQMDRSGAIGDLEKTMESYANQSRVMAEAWQQVVSYAGTILTYLIKQSGLFTYINAFLIFLGDTLKAVAENLNAIEHFGGDAFDTLTEGALGANEEIDKLQGKLLDFDKFRALNESETDMGIGLDEKLINALTNFDTILGKASMNAKNLADNLKKASGLFNGDGTFNTEKWSEVVDTIEAFGHALLVIVSTGVISKFVSGIRTIFISASGLSTVLVMGLALSILQAIDAFRDGDKLGGIFAITIGVTLVGAFIALKGVMIDGKLYLDLFGKTVNGTFLQITMGISMLIGGISLFIKNFDKLSISAKIWIPIISALAGAIASLAVGFTIMKGNWLGAISIGAMVAGAGLMVGTTLATQDFKNGGVPDRGTIFRAGEAGTEVVSHTNGVTEVTNVRQMEQAFFNALLRHSKTTNGKTEIIVNLDGEKVYKNTTEHAKQHGNTWNKS